MLGIGGARSGIGWIGTVESGTKVAELELTRPESVELRAGTGTDRVFSRIGGIRNVESGTEVMEAELDVILFKNKTWNLS